jgi:hypothetical protein
MRYLLIVLKVITYTLALFSFFLGFGEVVLLYFISSTSLVPYAEGSGKSTFGLWYFLSVLLVGAIAGLLSSISIVRFKWKNLRIATLVATIVATIMSIVDYFLPPSLNPLHIGSIDVLFVLLCVFYVLCVIVDLKHVHEGTKSTTAIG